MFDYYNGQWVLFKDLLFKIRGGMNNAPLIFIPIYQLISPKTFLGTS